ncbi:MAG: tRNA pseudouridine(55) synthase TruB [Planctomycetes bacterium]|nr:tRNA pseudouridine(55) synthase TruB [Planctomycetota bacterium]
MTDAAPPTPNGLLNLYKPVGKSSANYVYRLRRVFNLRKVGHAGTLDPFADGVLVACIGRGTKLVERLMNLPKHYRTTLRLGVTNATYDTEKPFDPVPGAAAPDRSAIETALTAMTGRIQQVPPSFSAVRIGGVQSYKLAARGAPAPRQPKEVRIDRIDILAYDYPTLTLDIHCGRGTYIRAIARDLGRILACGACCETLQRTAVGPFRVEDSVDLQTAPPDDVRAALLPLDEALRLLESP